MLSMDLFQLLPQRKTLRSGFGAIGVIRGQGVVSKKAGLCGEGNGHCGCLELTLLGNSGTLCAVMPKRSHQGASVGCTDVAMPSSH